MRVTKHEHAALTVRHDGAALVIDPGGFTAPFPPPPDLVAIVITHEHPDHWTAEHLRRLRGADIPIFAPEGVAEAVRAEGTEFEITVVTPGETQRVGPFELRFFGGKHAVIHESIPVVDNVGVLVNESLYYGGDSYAVPEGVSVDVLAAPVGAPWLKISEAMDYVLAVAAARVFSTHDMTLSPAGLNLGRARLTWAAEQGGGTFVALDPGDSIDF